MSTIVGALAVELGLDTAQFEAGLKKIPGMASTAFSPLSSEARRTAKEGAESLRLIDEQLGIHISRPVARIVTQEFPGLAKALQSVLGIGVAGALLVAGFEAISKAVERVDKAMEHAKKAQEDYEASQRKLQQTIAQTAEAFEKEELQIKEHMAELSGEKGAALSYRVQIIGIEDAERARRVIDELTAAIEGEQKAAQEAEAWTTRFWLAVYNFAHTTFSLSSTLGTEKLNKDFEELQHKLDAIHGPDALKKQLDVINEAVKEANLRLIEMQGHASNLGDQLKVVNIGTLVASVATGDLSGALNALREIRNAPTVYSDKEIAAQKSYLAGEKQIQDAIEKSIKQDKERAAAAAADSASRADVGERTIQQLKSTTEADLTLASATSKTTAEQKLATAAAEADQIISRIQEEAHGRLTRAIKEELLSVQALTATRQVAKDVISTNTELEKQVEAVKRQTDANKEMAAAYAQGGDAIAAAKVDEKLGAQVQKLQELRQEYNLVKKAADDYAASVASLGKAAGPKPGLDISPEHIAQLKAGVDTADAKLAELRTTTAAENQSKYQVEIEQTTRALIDEQPYLEALNAAYGQNEEVVRRAQVALQLFHWEQAHPGATADQIEQENEVLEQQSINAQRASDAKAAGQYSISTLYTDEIDKLTRIREQIIANGESTILIDAKIHDAQDSLIHQWDEAALKIGDFHDKFSAVMNELAIEGENAGKQIADSFLGAIHQSEDELAKFLTGQKVQPQKIVQNFAEAETKAKIQQYTGEIAAKFGVQLPSFAGKPDGTASNPLHVAIVGGLDLHGGTGGAGGIGVGGAGGSGGSSRATGPTWFDFGVGPGSRNGPGWIEHWSPNSPLNVPSLAGPALGRLTNTPDGSPSKPFYVVSATPEGSPVGKSAGEGAELPAGGAGAAASVPTATTRDLQPLNQTVNAFSQALLPFGGALAEGGQTRPGTAYLVGENGPELFRASTAGEVVPNRELAVRDRVQRESAIARSFGESHSRESLASASASESTSQRLSASHLERSQQSELARSIFGTEHVSSSTLEMALSSFEHRADGGPVKPGTVYLAGEKGPELFQAAPQAAPPTIGQPSLIPGGNQSWTFNPSAGGYTAQYEAYERWLHRGPSEFPLFASLGMIGLNFLLGGLLKPETPQQKIAKVAAAQPAQTGVLSELDALTASTPSAASVAPTAPTVAQAGPLDELNALTASIEPRAEGGSAEPGAVYLVGEKGPEVFKSSTSSVFQKLFSLFHHSSPAPAAQISSSAAARQDLDALTASESRGLPSNTSNTYKTQLPNAVRPGDVDAAYYQNWSREYSGSPPLSSSSTALATSSAVPLPAPAVEPAHPSFVNLPAFTGTAGISLDGFRASGGDVAAGSTYMVGERGPEIFRPTQHGEIIPNHLLHTVSNAVHMADGGDVFAGNSYLVGERGPEEFRVPGLSNVSNVSSRSGDTIHGDVIHGNVVNQTIKANSPRDLFGFTSKQQLQRTARRGQ